MRAALRSLSSFDVDDLSTWVPDSDDWAIGIRILAGPDNGPGEESFDLVACSPSWLAAQARQNGVVDARHHLVLCGFDWPLLSSYIERRVQQCEGATWNDIAERLSRLGYWEFEDYRE